MASPDSGLPQPGALLWRHPSPETTQMWHYLQSVNQRHGLEIKTYEELYTWSIEHVAAFWESVWQYTGIKSADYDDVSTNLGQLPKVMSHETQMFPRPAFFPGSRLNFAQNLLFPPHDIDLDGPAVISATEIDRSHASWRELRQAVKASQDAMREANIVVGDRIAGFVANHTNALVTMLAATSLGAIWTAISPDTGKTAVLDRLCQIEPVMLFCDNASVYNGKVYPTMSKVEEISSSLPSLRKVVIFATVPPPKAEFGHKAVSYTDFLNVKQPSQRLEFVPLPADHPVYILYSSGTTGAPKCLVHGAIGTLLQHKKEHILHCDIMPGDRLFYFTTCTWMMWHWLVSGLASGATIILYDGSPFRYVDRGESTVNDLAMPRLIDELDITHFGTSAKYLSVLEQKRLSPKDHGISLSSLKAIYSTGSPLAPSTFSYVYRSFGDVNLGSITGGTDIISLFGAPCPLTPVYCGEIQVPGLGMAIRAWDAQGNDVTHTGEPGDLVCTKPFISQPVSFWGSDGVAKYRSSYFETFDGVWHHGDYVRFNSLTMGLYMLGRSDGILKPSGVRFGSAEIYNLLLAYFPAETEDALCIGRRRETDSDETVVLFVKMKPGVDFSQDLAARIKQVVRRELSARHVPAIIDHTPEIPITTNGKKIENAVKQILCGINVKTLASVANSECLEWYRSWARAHPD